MAKILIIILFLFSANAFSEDLSFSCNSSNTNDGKNWENKNLAFVTDMSTIPERKLCGKTYEECIESGFKEYIACNDDKCFNYPILIAKYCLPIPKTSDFTEVRVGVVPHLDKVTLSIRVNGQNDMRIWTSGAIKPSEEILELTYNFSPINYVTKCKVQSKLSTPHSQKLIYGKEINLCTK